MKLASTLALAAALVATGAGTAMAGMSSGYVDRRQEAAEMSTQSIGDLLAAGRLTEPQVTQLVQFTGLDVETAKKYTIPEVVAMRWTNN